jgi:response regulator RpfG family c-di-GMP phosphodiesterase
MVNSFGSRLILCVDNDVDSCAAFKVRLSGYNVMVAHAADTGIGVARKSPFDVYLVNAELPLAGAVEFCRVVRSFDPNTPILVYNAPEKLEDCSAFMTGMKIHLVGYSSTASLTAMLATAIEECWVESLTARVAEQAAVLEELKGRSTAVRVRMWNSWKRSQDLRARVIRGKAYRAFAAAGGNRANFIRMLDENALIPSVSKRIRESMLSIERRRLSSPENQSHSDKRRRLREHDPQREGISGTK